MSKLTKIRINDNVYNLDSLSIEDVKNSIIGEKYRIYNTHIDKSSDNMTNIDWAILEKLGRCIEIDSGAINMGTKCGIIEHNSIIAIFIDINKIEDKNKNEIYFIDDQGNEESVIDFCLRMNMLCSSINEVDEFEFASFVGGLIVNKGRLHDNVEYSVEKYCDRRTRIYFFINDKDRDKWANFVK